MLDKISLIFVILGSINWALTGLFKFDLVAWIFGSSAHMGSRIVYTIIGLCGLWCISFLFRGRERIEHDNEHHRYARSLD